MEAANTAGVPLRPVLDEVGRINTLFRVGAVTAEPGWRPLTGGGLSARDLAAQVEHVRARLAEVSGCPASAVEWRVAASVFHQGLATRVLSPVLAAGLCHGALVNAGGFRWHPGGSVELRTAQEYAARADGGAAGVADWIEDTVVTGVADRMARTLSRIGRIAPGLLRGNTAAALAGAVRALGSDRPGVRGAAESVARDLLARPGLVGTGAYRGVDAEGLAVFSRTTCCLYYRLPGGGLCGDCALRERTGPGPGQAR